MIHLMLNHLWRATLILAVACVLSRVLRDNAACTRYRVWFAASLGFLVPFSLLVRCARQASARAVMPVMSAPLSMLAERVSAPFGPSPVSLHVSATAGSVSSAWPLSPIALAVWAFGGAAVLLLWSLRAWRIRALVRAATPLRCVAPVPVLSSPIALEPGLAAGHDAQGYAETILQVCRWCVPSPLASRAGVSGGPLRRRVEAIMRGQSVRAVGSRKRLLVATALAVAFALPVMFGMFGLSVATARAAAVPAQGAHPTRSRLLYEQTRPQKEVPFKPAAYDKYVGYYEFGHSGTFAHVFRHGRHYFVQLTGQRPVEVFPESPRKFFATVVAAQSSFTVGPHGAVTGMELHQNGRVQFARRVSRRAYVTENAKLERRVKADVPSPGTQAWLVRWIGSVEAGYPDYAGMGPQLAAAARRQSRQAARIMHRLGAFRSLTFVKVAANGWDQYLGTFTHGRAMFLCAPLGPHGKAHGQFWYPL